MQLGWFLCFCFQSANLVHQHISADFISLNSDCGSVLIENEQFKKNKRKRNDR